LYLAPRFLYIKPIYIYSIYMTVQPQSERDVRLEKAKQLKERGITPYANSFDKKHTIAQLHSESDSAFRDSEEIVLWPKNNIQTAWRLTLYREHGKLAFWKLLDSTGEIQLMRHKNSCALIPATNQDPVQEVQGMSAFKFVEKMVDVGDFIGVEGELFYTHKGERTIFVSSYQLLTKTIRPLPEKRHGLQDKESCYRERYLDMTMSNDTYQRFLFKSTFYKTLRDFYHEQWFTEIETSILWNAASWAAAAPFSTYHNDFGCDFFLRIAFETALKKATAGRFEKVFEIGKDFRNEWSDPSHVQEFTQVEHYAAYWNYEDNMRFTEQMFDYIFDTMKLERKIPVKDKEWKEKIVTFTTPFERIDYVQWVNKASGLDITQYGMDEADKLRDDIKKQWIEFAWMDTMGTTTLIDYLYKKVLRPSILWPAFIYNYPKIMQPLARASDDRPNIVEQFQLVINGREVCKAYSELVDPAIQQANFDEQALAAAAWDTEATSEDSDFVRAMEHGMPPQSWFGMGLERILAILTQQENLRDVIMFPLMKPQQGEQQAIPNPAATQQLDNQPVYENIPSITQAKELANKYLNDTLEHCEMVGRVMAYFAKELWQDKDTRYIAWLLHDVDWDHINKDPEQHLWEQFEKIVAEIDLPDQLIADIRSHYTEKTGVPVDLLIRKYLSSVDELTGFLYAYARMRPEWFDGIKVSSVKKKIKDKKFAAWVDREHLKYCETYLWIPLEEFIPQVVNALQSYK